MKLSETIKRKFIDIISLKNWQVKSEGDDGEEIWNDIESVNKTIPYEIYELTSETGRKIKCADTHILIGKYGDEVFAKDSLGVEVKTDTGVERIKSVKRFHKEVNMYDLSLGKGSNHLFYTNGFLSHNSTAYNIYCLWLLCFHKDKAIMLAANKAATANELLGRIKMAYEYLPSWLKPGVVSYSKTEMVLANKSKIHAFPTASSGCRGFSANCVNKNSIITMRFTWLRWLPIRIPIKWLRLFGTERVSDWDV